MYAYRHAFRPIYKVGIYDSGGFQGGEGLGGLNPPTSEKNHHLI